MKGARKVIEASVREKETPDLDLPDKFDKKMGVFVTLNKYPSEELRGCIGYPEPIYPLKKALTKGAENATRDPRFSALKEEELDSVIVEVTLLTKPEEIEVDDPEELPKRIECGKDGLIVQKGRSKGLLLPQVPVEQGWDEEEFLSHTCMKARLRPNDWRSGGCTISKFQGEIFKETEPYGDIVKREIA